MNKKKLVICLLIFVMVLSLALTALVGCKPDPDEDPSPDDTTPAGYKKMNTSLSSALSDAVYNTTGEHKVNSLAATASLKVTAKYGESTSQYLIKFGANVALKPDDTNTTKFGLSIVDSKANANILNAHYIEWPADASATGYQRGQGALYVDLGSGNDAQKFAINAMSIKSVLKSEGVNISNEQATAINDTVGDGIDGVLNDISMIFGIGEVYQKNDNSEVLFSLSLAKFFENAGALLDGLSVIDEYTEKLGLDLKSTDIKTLLPALTLDLHVKMDDAEADNFEDAIITGVDVQIGVASKDFKIKRTDGSNFVRINIDKDVSLDLDLDFKFGGTPSIPSIIGSSYDAYKAINLINFTAGGELDLKAGINVNIKLSDNGTPENPDDDKNLDLKIPQGVYNIKIAADINPVALLGMSFNTDGSIDSIVTLVTNILTNAVNVLDLEITPKDTTQSGKLVLKVAPNASNVLAITFDASLLGSTTVNSIANILNGVPVSGLVGAINTILPMLGVSSDDNSGAGSGEPDVSGETNVSGEQISSGSSGADVDAILDVIAGIIKNLTIGVNDGSDLLKVVFENYVIAENELEDENGKPINTTISASIIGNKTTGLTLKADVKGIVMGPNSNDISAEIKVNGDGVKVTAKATKAFEFGDIELPIDLVLTFNQFELGNAQAA